MKFLYIKIVILLSLCVFTHLKSQNITRESPVYPTIITSTWHESSLRDTCDRQYFQIVTICEGQRFRVADSFYIRAGRYVNHTLTARGCDSTITTFLSFIASSRTDTSVTLCLGKCFRVGTKCYTQTGNFRDTLQSLFGCDSIISLNLRVLRPDSTEQNPIICIGDSIKVGNKTYKVTGNYRDTLPNIDGCFRLIKTNLTVRPKVSTLQNVTLCKGNSVIVGTHTYDRTGVYLDTLRAITGCDSFITSNITVLDSVKKTIDSTICSGKSVFFNDTFRLTTGTYKKILRAVNGCDSTIILNLTVTPPINSTIDSTICSGKSVQIGDSTYSSTGRYIVNTTDIGGCKRIITLNLMVTPPLTSRKDTSICSGKSVIFNGNTYSKTGIYSIRLRTSGGCDSTATLNLNVPRPDSTLKTIILCATKDTLINGIRYNQTTTVRDTLKAVSACDSIVKVLNIIVLNKNETLISKTLCKNQTFLAAGIYRDTFRAFNGCDSVVITTLTLKDTVNTRQSKEICSGDSVKIGLKYYSVTGNYIDTLRTSGGCDSIVFTNLKKLDPLSTQQSKTICKGENVRVGTKIYTLAGVYTDKLTSIKGCDSLVKTTITVNELPILTLPKDLTAKYCSIDSIALNPQADTASKYQWTWKTVPCSTCRNPKIKTILTTTYYVTVTDITTSCKASDSVKVVIQGTITEKIPNVFTPNADNLNDVFNVVPDECVKIVSRLQIFTRWGHKIYDEINLSPQNKQGWNGQLSGKFLGSDVYIYMMDIEFIDGTTKKISGEVNLLH